MVLLTLLSLTIQQKVIFSDCSCSCDICLMLVDWSAVTYFFVCVHAWMDVCIIYVLTYCEELPEQTPTDVAGLDDDRGIQETEGRSLLLRGVAPLDVWTYLRAENLKKNLAPTPDIISCSISSSFSISSQISATISLSCLFNVHDSHAVLNTRLMIFALVCKLIWRLLQMFPKPAIAPAAFAIAKPSAPLLAKVAVPSQQAFQIDKFSQILIRLAIYLHWDLVLCNLKYQWFRFIDVTF